MGQLWWSTKYFPWHLWVWIFYTAMPCPLSTGSLHRNCCATAGTGYVSTYVTGVQKKMPADFRRFLFLKSNNSIKSGPKYTKLAPSVEKGTMQLCIKFGGNRWNSSLCRTVTRYLGKPLVSQLKVDQSTRKKFSRLEGGRRKVTVTFGHSLLISSVRVVHSKI